MRFFRKPPLGGFPIFRIVSPPCRHLKRWKHGCFQPAHDVMRVRRLAAVVDSGLLPCRWLVDECSDVVQLVCALVMAIWRRGIPGHCCIIPIAEPIHKRAVPAVDGSRSRRRLLDEPVRQHLG
jgi:hypothetical protein